MAGKRYPWWPMFPADWLSDANLNRCSLAAEGMLIRALNIAYQLVEPGRFFDGKNAWTRAQIVQATGAKRGAAKALDELIAVGALRVDSQTGAIFSKRMVEECGRRDAEAERKAKERAALSGHCPADNGAIVRPLSGPLSGHCPPHSDSEPSIHPYPEAKTKTIKAGRQVGFSVEVMDGWMAGDGQGKDLKAVLRHLGIRGPNLDALAASGLTLDQVREELASIDGDKQVRNGVAVLTRRLLTKAGIEPGRKLEPETKRMVSRIEELRRQRGISE